MTLALPIGICPTTIGVSASWWLEVARRAEDVGIPFVGAWDHFVSRGERRDPVLECWTTLAAAAAITSRVRLGSFVANVLDRHPAVLARMVATVADVGGGRVEVGIGSGGYAAELAAYGIAFPPAAERWARLEEAVSVLRLLLAGGPADFEGRFYRLEGAHAFPAPQPPPRITVAGGTPVGARLAARIGDAWTCPADRLEALLPVFYEAFAAAGRGTVEVPVVVGVGAREVIEDPVAAAAGWRERGASELVVHWVRPRQLEPLLDALARAA